jgi:hypothetical protein
MAFPPSNDFVQSYLLTQIPFLCHLLSLHVSISFTLIDLMKHVGVQEADRVAEKVLGRNL